MESRKGIALTISTVVILVVLLLLMVIIITATTGSLGDLFKDVDTTKDVSDADIAAAKSTCDKWCLDAGRADSVSDWSSTDYCASSVAIAGSELNCKDSPINVKCENSFRDALTGDLVVCDETDCSGCSFEGCQIDTTSSRAKCEGCGGQYAAGTCNNRNSGYRYASTSLQNKASCEAVSYRVWNPSLCTTDTCDVDETTCTSLGGTWG